MTLPLSIFIIAKNEADRIVHTLNSVKGLAEEVIVIDSGSTDDTVKVAESLGVRVIYNEWKGYGPQKCFAETQCKNNWLLNLDADEALSPELVQEIRLLFATGEPRCTAYRLDIKILFPGETSVPRYAPHNRVLRLYDKRKAGFKDSAVHDTVVVREGKTGELQHIVVHRCFRSLEHWVAKIQSYSTLQAEDFVKKGRRPYAARIILEPPIAFLKAYLLRRYCFYGMDGFIGSFLYAYGRLLRLAKARELYKKR